MAHKDIWERKKIKNEEPRSGHFKFLPLSTTENSGKELKCPGLMKNSQNNSEIPLTCNSDDKRIEKPIFDENKAPKMIEFFAFLFRNQRISFENFDELKCAFQ